MNEPTENEHPTVTVLLPVKFTYEPSSLMWFIASAQTPEIREERCLAAAYDMFNQCLDYLNGVEHGKNPEHTPEVVVSLPLPKIGKLKDS